MNIIFFGNTQYSLIGAKIIHDSLGLSKVITINDRPDKRGRLIASPLKIFALEKDIPLLTIDQIDDAIIEQLAAFKPDFFIVEDYGLILPDALLNIPKHASLNIHHSLLPRYRGPSPAPTAILNGDSVTGVTVMKMATEVDAGDILAQEKYTLKPDETTQSLLTILNTLGAELLVGVIKDFEHVKPQVQDEEKATFTERMKKEDGYFDLTNPPAPEKLDRMIRAFYPWPTAWTKFEMANGKWQMAKFLPGNKIQPEGGKPMNIKDFLNGYPQMREHIEKLLI